MPPGNQQNPYEFITNPAPPPRRKLNLGNSMGARFALIAGAVILFIIVAVVVSSFFNRENKAQVERLTEVAQSQSEIIRISALADKKAKDIKTRNLAANTRLSVESSQQEVKKLLNGRGVGSKGLDKKLGAGKNTKTDATLDEAARNNRYDETFAAVIEKQLADYQKLLTAAHQSGTANEKKTLSALFQNSKLLAGEPASGQTAQ